MNIEKKTTDEKTWKYIQVNIIGIFQWIKSKIPFSFPFEMQNGIKCSVVHSTCSQEEHRTCRSWICNISKNCGDWKVIGCSSTEVIQIKTKYI